MTIRRCSVAGATQSNFTVGLVRRSPDVQTPKVTDSTVCGQGPASAAAGQTMFVQCADRLPPVRYVVIFGHSNRLEICELEVYGKGKFGGLRP